MRAAAELWNRQAHFFWRCLGPFRRLPRNTISLPSSRSEGGRPMRKVIGLFLGLSILGLSPLGPLAAQNKKAPVLIKELEDKNPKVRAGAAEDIGSLADVRLADAKTALPALRTALK